MPYLFTASKEATLTPGYMPSMRQVGKGGKMTSTITDCGAANLLGAIFGEDVDNIKAHLGMPLPYPKCPQCGEYIKRKDRLFCSSECRYAFTHIILECPECEQLFQRNQSLLLHRATKPLVGNGKLQERFYCSRKCLARFLGRTYGFAAHPENRAVNLPGGNRKWDWDLVLHLQRETSYGARRLSRLTRIPESTISVILHKVRY